MNVVILSNGLGRFRQIKLSSRSVFALTSLFAVALGGLAFFGGYYYSAVQGSGISRSEVASLHEAMQTEKAGIEKIRRNTEATLKALATQLSHMQARVIYIDGFARRLGELSDLTEDEFDFNSSGLADTLTNHSYKEGPSKVPEILVAMEQLDLHLDQHEVELGVLESMLLNQKLSARIYPQGSPVLSGWLSSYYGRRTDPITGKPAVHLGVDFAGKPGDEIIAVADGVVIWSDDRYGFGKLVEINHGNGYMTRYAHNEENLVTVGEEVEKGQKIALMGDTGRSVGTNLHFEVLKNGERINPAPFIRRTAD
ncbi:MAG: hypothetical protein CMO98_10130 [Woeseia sp.]|nr:hypothetical protein [Woeseia sp.]